MYLQIQKIEVTVIRMILFIGQKMNRGDLKCFGIN